MTAILRPPRLRQGSRVALVAPAGPVDEERIRTAVARCEMLGLEPVLSEAARLREGYLAGPDDTRGAELQRALTGPGLDAVWALRGGYGVMRVLPRLSLEALAQRPRVVVGFSDNTALLLALRQRGLVAFHGPHAGSRSFPPATEVCFRSVLFETGAAGMLPWPEAMPPAETLRDGVVEGELIGGNLALLAAMCGTPWQPRARNCILFVEDVDEPLYRIDRMLAQLRLAGVLDGVAGLALGRFSSVDRGDEHAALSALLREHAAALRVPAVAGLPVGHDSENWTLPLGVRARLDAGAATLELLEPAVD